MAAEAVRPTRRKQALRVLDVFLGGGSYTTDDVVNKLGLLHQSVSARMSELAKAGCFEDTGRTKVTAGGKKPAALWTATDGGEERYLQWVKGNKLSKIRKAATPQLGEWETKLIECAKEFADKPDSDSRLRLLAVAMRAKP